LQEHTAGSPVAPEVIWTDLTATAMAEQLTQRGLPVSAHIVEQLLDEHGYHRRQAQKEVPLGESRDRDTQFRRIAELRQQFLDAGDPVLSIDTKKREWVGNFYRAGVLLTRERVATFDHDFPKFADGVVIPHGLYDVRHNRGYVHLGTSHDTSAFACDCLRDWWLRVGQVPYPESRAVLLCDGGRQQQRQHLPVQGGGAGVGGCVGVSVPGGALPAVLLEVPPERASAVLPPESGRRVAAEVKQGLQLVRDALLPKFNDRIFPRRKTS
jgi:hypothetical protein